MRLGTIGLQWPNGTKSHKSVYLSLQCGFETGRRTSCPYMCTRSGIYGGTLKKMYMSLAPRRHFYLKYCVRVTKYIVEARRLIKKKGLNRLRMTTRQGGGVRRIGSGSGGTVYKVRHRPSSKTYALKVIYGHHEDSVRRQICREIEILRAVDHPNVVRCHGLFDHSGEIQVLLEFMDGGSLESLHLTHEPSLADLSFQILSGLSYLHRRKIVHRDIKPSNLLINARKQVKIADFGVGRILAQTMDPCNSSVGTIAYMSPERINTDLNRGVYDGYAGDIWSFGVSILEFYLGRFPFAVSRQGDWASLMCAICIAPPPEAPGTASRELREFLGCCLQKEPARRWTAAQLLSHPFVLQSSPGGGGGGGGGVVNGGGSRGGPVVQIDRGHLLHH
ncbi:hypothetical protein Scep_023371 [Stephania cephalantha]|uniref:mitogen-activated protein kinase kinase n=1 Tax=Stephania cephalantha TaxID=152367 RepID=A0AAP0EVI1_9MAGN